MGDITQMVYIVEHGDTAWTQTGQHAGRQTCRCHLAAKTQRVPSTVSATTARPCGCLRSRDRRATLLERANLPRNGVTQMVLESACRWRSFRWTESINGCDLKVVPMIVRRGQMIGPCRT
jgi:hypothetical protein